MLWNRRQAMATLAATALGGSAFAGKESTEGPFRMATFEADVTPPIGHPLMGGGIEPAKTIVDRLAIKGVVLTSQAAPIVIAAIDWCEIRNDAYDAWKAALANAAATEPDRVFLSCLNQHDAPIADLEAERILERNGCKGRICDLDFHEKAVAAAAKAVGSAFLNLQPITRIGMGAAVVEKVASNRRYVGDDGKPRYDRMSATRDPAIREKPEGTIDPKLRALSFWNGQTPVAVLNSYATHPMSFYGKGGVSDDFVGLARRRRQKALPGVFQMYISGCSGNVVAGKYNDGSPANREILADRIEKGMADAWKATKFEPLKRFVFQSVPLKLAARGGAGFELDDLDKKLRTSERPFDQCLAALGLSRLLRLKNVEAIDVPCIDFGPAAYLVLPGEAYVEFQLAAADLRPSDLIMVAGYGECSTGYIPTARALAEDDSNLRDWCWVAPSSDQRVIQAVREALGA